MAEVIRLDKDNAASHNHFNLLAIGDAANIIQGEAFDGRAVDNYGWL